MAESSGTTSGEQSTYSWVGWTLLGALLISIGVMAIGLLVGAVRGGDTSTVLPIGSLGPQLRHGSAAALLDAGILLLFAAPLAGVVIAFVRFVRERDGASAITTLLLLAMLAVAIGIAFH